MLIHCSLKLYHFTSIIIKSQNTRFLIPDTIFLRQTEFSLNKSRTTHTHLSYIILFSLYLYTRPLLYASQLRAGNANNARTCVERKSSLARARSYTLEGIALACISPAIESRVWPVRARVSAKCYAAPSTTIPLSGHVTGLKHFNDFPSVSVCV